MRNSLICLAALAVGSTIAAPALGGSLGVTIDQRREIGGTVNATLGWSFTANQAVLVDGLGFWDDTFASGLDLPHQVGLWNADGSVLLASTTIQAGTASALIGGFRFESIAPVALVAGREYVLGAFFPSGAVEDYNYDATGQDLLKVTFANGITYQRARFLNSSTFGFPTGIDAPGNLGSFGPNLSISAVPEPTGAALWGLGAVGLAAIGRWRRGRTRRP